MVLFSSFPNAPDQLFGSAEAPVDVGSVGTFGQVARLLTPETLCDQIHARVYYVNIFFSPRHAVVRAVASPASLHLPPEHVVRAELGAVRAHPVKVLRAGGRAALPATQLRDHVHALVAEAFALRRICCVRIVMESL